MCLRYARLGTLKDFGTLRFVRFGPSVGTDSVLLISTIFGNMKYNNDCVQLNLAYKNFIKLETK